MSSNIRNVSFFFIISCYGFAGDKAKYEIFETESMYPCSRYTWKVLHALSFLCYIMVSLNSLTFSENIVTSVERSTLKPLDYSRLSDRWRRSEAHQSYIMCQEITLASVGGAMMIHAHTNQQDLGSKLALYLHIYLKSEGPLHLSVEVFYMNHL